MTLMTRAAGVAAISAFLTSGALAQGTTVNPSSPQSPNNTVESGPNAKTDAGKSAGSTNSGPGASPGASTGAGTGTGAGSSTTTPSTSGNSSALPGESSGPTSKSEPKTGTAQ